MLQFVFFLEYAACAFVLALLQTAVAFTSQLEERTPRVAPHNLGSALKDKTIAGSKFSGSLWTVTVGMTQMRR